MATSKSNPIRERAIRQKMVKEIREMVEYGLREDEMVKEFESKFGKNSSAKIPNILRQMQGLNESTIDEEAPKGWEGTVKGMKKHKGEIDNPWALSWWMKNKGYKSHKTKTGKDKNESIDEAGSWNEANPRIIQIKHKGDEYVGVSREDRQMMSAFGLVGGRFWDNQLDNEQRHAANKGYRYEVVDESRDYYMNETLRQIQMLSGIKK